MSSFVISKQEYIKAGGFFAGLAEQKNYYREPVIYWWDSTKGGLLDAEDYYKAFASLYEMNARSVMLQYGESRMQSDEADYRKDYEHRGTHHRNCHKRSHCRIKLFHAHSPLKSFSQSSASSSTEAFSS